MINEIHYNKNQRTSSFVNQIKLFFGSDIYTFSATERIYSSSRAYIRFGIFFSLPQYSITKIKCAPPARNLIKQSDLQYTISDLDRNHKIFISAPKCQIDFFFLRPLLKQKRIATIGYLELLPSSFYFYFFFFSAKVKHIQRHRVYMDIIVLCGMGGYTL